MNRSVPPPARPAWDTVVLACRACRKRRRGPAGLTGRLAVREARAAVRHVRPRPRVASTGCLGLCPDGAVALAVAGAGRATAWTSAGSATQVGEAVLALLARDRSSKG